VFFFFKQYTFIADNETLFYAISDSKFIFRPTV